MRRLLSKKPKEQTGIYRETAHYVFLNVRGMLMLAAYILADTLFIANGVGAVGLAALTLVLPVYSFISGFGLMLGMGAATRFASCPVPERRGRGSRIFSQAILAALGCGALFCAAGHFFNAELAALLGADYETLPHISNYLRGFLSFAPIHIINNILLCFVRNDGNPRLSMTGMMAWYLGNICFDIIVIFGWGIGLLGTGMASGIAPALSLCVLSRHFMKRKNSFRFVFARPVVADVLRSMNIGLSAFITEFSSGVIMVVFNLSILGLSGNTGVAAYGIVANLALVAVAVYTGFAQGIQPVVNRRLRQGQVHDAGRVLRFAFMCVLGTAALLNLAGLLFATPIVGFFDSENNHELVRMATRGIHLYFLSFFFMGMNIVAASYFASLLKPAQSFAVSFARGFAAILPLILILSRLFGMDGVWISVSVSETFTICLSALFLFAGLKGVRA